jgi:hypothetical protein
MWRAAPGTLALSCFRSPSRWMPLRESPFICSLVTREYRRSDRFLLGVPKSSTDRPVVSLSWRLALLFLVCLLFVGAGEIQAATHVQQASNSNVSGSTFSSFSAAFGSATTAGNAIVIGVTFGNVNPTITAIDTQGNTYTQAIKTYDPGHNQGSAILYATNIKGGASVTVTIKFSSAVAYLALGIHEYSGIAATAALDKTAGARGMVGSPSSGAATTTVAGDLIFIVGVEDSTGSGDSFTAGSGFTKRVDLGIAGAYADGDQTQAAAGSIAATWTVSPSGRSWIADLAAFKAPAGAGGVTPGVASLLPSSAAAGGTAFTLTVNGTGFVSASVVNWNGSARATTFGSATQIMAQIPASDISGSTTASITVTNLGPGGGTSLAQSFPVNAPLPFISGLSPPLATAGGAAFMVTVNGSNFIANSVVNWNGSPRATTFVTSSQIRAQITAANIAASSTASVTVTNPAPGGGISVALPLPVNASLPSISTLSPLSVTAGGAAFTLVVNGSNFIANSGVRWNGSPRTTTFVTPIQITAQIPATDIAGTGAASVTAVNPGPGGGTSSAQSFPVNASPPSLANLSPAAGPLGSPVTVSGANFGATQSTSTVTFGGIANAPVTSWSATTIGLLVPVGASTGNVFVSVNSQVSNALPFTVVPGPPPIIVSVTPSPVNVQAGISAQQFTATVTNTTNTAVTWQVNGLTGGNATVGTISASGLYSAPASVPNPATVTVSAISVADPARSGNASVTVTAPISVSVAPSSVTVLAGATAQFTATVANDLGNKGVTWSVSCSVAQCGSMSPTTTPSGTPTTYTAPANPPTSNLTVTITATSVTDTTKSNSAAITVPAITISVAPPTATVAAGTTQQFTATVTNTSNTAVTWKLTQGGAACTAACGTLSGTTTNPVTYTAPGPPAGNLTITITATSVADSTKSSSGTITVRALGVAVAPTSANVPAKGTQPFTATVSNDASNKGVTWTLTQGGTACSPGCGTITAATLSGSPATYTAPASVPADPAVTVTATSVADGTKSAMATATVVGITVSVSPPSASVVVSATKQFIATVTNDVSSSGVTWTLTQGGVACSPTCGVIAPASTASGTPTTYTAPGTVPANATVTLTATSVADPTKSALATITVVDAPPVPTLVQWASCSSTINSNAVNVTYNCRLPNLTLAGNLVVADFTWGVTAGLTATVTDDKAQSYTLGKDQADANQHLAKFFFPNTAAGAQVITIKFDGGTATFVSAIVKEYRNVATTSPLDGTCSGNNGMNTVMTAGTMTTVTNGDLIDQFAVNTTSGTFSSITQGASPWKLLATDLLDGQASQYQVQATAGAINPTFAQGNSELFVTQACAFKAAAAGTAPAAGIRIIGVQGNSVKFTTSPITLQFPCSGNLVLVALITVPGYVSNANPTDGNSNSYVQTAARVDDTTAGDTQGYYAKNANCTTTMTGPTITTTCTACSGSSTVKLYDITGADPTEPLSATAALKGVQSVAGDLVTSGLTTLTANELVVADLGINAFTVTGCNGPAGCLFDSTNYAGEGNPSPTDQNNGWAHFYKATAGATGNFTWQNNAPSGVQQWNWQAWSFKAPP